MELVLKRSLAMPSRTPGELFVNGVFFGYTLEDKVREVAGRPVAEWKVAKATAIAEARYWLTLEKSPHFGDDTPTLNGVEGFEHVRMHGGNTEADTEGCILVGYALTAVGTIVAGLSQPMLANLRRNLRQAIARGEKCFIDVRNPA